MAKNTNPERVEKLAREDKILETDLLQRYEEAETEQAKQELKQEWKRRHPLKNFNNHLAAYNEKNGGRLGEKSEIKERVKQRTKVGIYTLKEEVDRFYSQKVQILAVLERFEEKGLKTTDLLSGSYQEDAIMTVFEENPEMGMNLVEKLNSNDAGLQKEAEEILVKLKGYLDRYRVTTEKSSASVREFSETLTGDWLKDTLKNVVEYAKEKPLVSLASVGLMSGLAYYTLFRGSGDAHGAHGADAGHGADHGGGHGEESLGKKIAKYLGIAGLTVGGLWGVNNLTAAIRDDEKTLWDIATFSLDIGKYDKVSQLFKDELYDMTDDDRASFESIMHLGESKGGFVAEAYDFARRNEKKEIDPKILFSSKDISVDRARQIDGAGLYLGFESLLRIIAEKKLGMDKDSDDAVHAGLEYFKANYSDRKLIYVINELYADHKVSIARNPDGSVNESDPRVKDEKSKFTLSESERAQESNISGVFKKFDVDAKVKQRIGGIVLINGYPYEYKFNSDKKTHEFKDVIGDKKTITVDEASAPKAALASITAHSETTMKEKFASQIGGANIEFDKDQGEWVIKGRKLNAIPGMGITDLEVDITVKAGDTAHLTMYREGSDTPYTDFDSLMTDAANDLVEARIREDIDYLIGKTAFVVEGIRGSGDRGTFEIKYLGKIGKVTYKNGRVESVNLPTVEGMKSERQSAAEHTFEERMSDLKVNDKSANQVFEDLGNMFHDKWEEFGVRGSWSDLMNRLGQRWNNEAPLMYDREAVWKETVQAKRDEIKTMMVAKIMVLMETNPDKATFDMKVKEYFEELGVELSHLEDEADQVSHEDIDGANFDEAIHRATEKMQELKYESAKYKGFMDSVEEKMIDAKLDYVGNDGMSYARGIRSEMRHLVFEYTMPIPGMKDSEIGQVEERYLAIVLTELPNILKDALKAKDGNFDFLIDEDKRIDRTGFEKAFKARIKQTYEEFKADEDSRFGSSTVTGRANNGASSLTGRIEGNVEKIGDEEDFAITKLNEAFAPIENLESTWFTSQFGALIGMRKEQLTREIAQVAQHSTSPEQARVGMEKALDKARREVMEYKTYVPRAKTDSLPVLKEASQKILNNMIDKPNWEAPARKLFNWLNGNFEFEHTYLIDNPEQMTFILGVYLEKCMNGRYDVSADKAMAYTDYFIFELDKVLPDDINISIDNISGTTRQMSDKEWREAVTKIQAIKSYPDYYSADAKPNVSANDLDSAVDARIKAEKEKSNEDFMDWFEKEMDPAEWFGLEGEWPDIYRAEVTNRLARLKNDPKYKTNEEYQKALQKYTEYVRVEQRYFKMLIKADLNPDLKTVPLYGINLSDSIEEVVVKTLEEQFNVNFNAGKSAVDYNQALEAALGTKMKIAAIIDATSVIVGPFVIPSPDPINFTP